MKLNLIKRALSLIVSIGVGASMLTGLTLNVGAESTKYFTMSIGVTGYEFQQAGSKYEDYYTGRASWTTTPVGKVTCKAYDGNTLVATGKLQDEGYSSELVFEFNLPTSKWKIGKSLTFKFSGLSDLKDNQGNTLMTKFFYFPSDIDAVKPSGISTSYKTIDIKTVESTGIKMSAAFMDERGKKWVRQSGDFASDSALAGNSAIKFTYSPDTKLGRLDIKNLFLAGKGSTIAAKGLKITLDADGQKIGTYTTDSEGDIFFKLPKMSHARGLGSYPTSSIERLNLKIEGTLSDGKKINTTAYFTAKECLNFRSAGSPMFDTMLTVVMLEEAGRGELLQNGNFKDYYASDDDDPIEGEEPLETWGTFTFAPNDTDPEPDEPVVEVTEPPYVSEEPVTEPLETLPPVNTDSPVSEPANTENSDSTTTEKEAEFGNIAIDLTNNVSKYKLDVYNPQSCAVKLVDDKGTQYGNFVIKSDTTKIATLKDIPVGTYKIVSDDTMKVTGATEVKVEAKKTATIKLNADPVYTLTVTNKDGSALSYAINGVSEVGGKEHKFVISPDQNTAVVDVKTGSQYVVKLTNDVTNYTLELGGTSNLAVDNGDGATSDTSQPYEDVPNTADPIVTTLIICGIVVLLGGVGAVVFFLKKKKAVSDDE